MTSVTVVITELALITKVKAVGTHKTNATKSWYDVYVKWGLWCNSRRLGDFTLKKTYKLPSFRFICNVLKSTLCDIERVGRRACMFVAAGF